MEHSLLAFRELPADPTESIPKLELNKQEIMLGAFNGHEVESLENRSMCAIAVFFLKNKNVGKRQLSKLYFFGFAFTSFIGVSQHTGTHAGSHPQGSSTTIISPHSSHLYFVPFFAIHLHLLASLLHKNLALLLNIRLFERLFMTSRKAKRAFQPVYAV